MADEKPEEGMTYKGSGIDYDAMDPYKRRAQLTAQTTNHFVERFGFRVVLWTRGESAFLIETPWGYLAHVEEGLGTKNLVADAMREIVRARGIGRISYYGCVARCNVAMAVNDMITLGALPVSYAQHLAVGHSDWFHDEDTAGDLIDGTRLACELSACAWGGGETPTLPGIVEPSTALLSGSALGVILDKRHLINPTNVCAGDVIMLCESSGIHANGLTMARRIAAQLPNGYATELPGMGGLTYGDCLLEPTHIYVGLIDMCQRLGVDIHYAVNITGHGWRKLMRAPGDFSYIIDVLPTAQPIFDFIQKEGPVNDYEAYGNFNMGAGFALIVPERDVRRVFEAAAYQPYRVFEAGHIEAGMKKVHITPKNLVYGGSTLAVR